MKSIGQILVNMLPSITETYIDKLLATTTIGINDMTDNAQLEMRLHKLSDRLSEIQAAIKSLEIKMDNFSHDLSVVHAEIYDIQKDLK